MTAANTTRSRAAERMRRSRELRRYGFIGVVNLPVHREEVTALIEGGCLAREHACDCDEIVWAIWRVFDKALFGGALGRT